MFTFGLTDFPFVNDLGLNTEYSPISMTALQEAIDEMAAVYGDDMAAFEEANAPYLALLAFLDAVKGAQVGEASDNVLLARVRDGIVSEVYGPGVFQHPDNPDQIILGMGDNTYTATVKDGKLICGALKGTITVSEVKDPNGKIMVSEKTGNKILSATAQLRKSGSKEIYVAELKLDGQQPMEVSDVVAAIEDGEPPIGTLLRKQGAGVSFTDLRLLPPGEYLCTDIEYKGRHEEYGNSWLMYLQAGDVAIGPVMSRGKDCIAALGGEAADETKGQWKLLKARAKQNGGITFNLASHTVKIGNQEYAFMDWAGNESLFNSQDANHFIKCAFFSKRLPQRLAVPAVVAQMITRQLPSSNSNNTATALPPSIPTVPVQAMPVGEPQPQLALTGVGTQFNGDF